MFLIQDTIADTMPLFVNIGHVQIVPKSCVLAATAAFALKAGTPKAMELIQITLQPATIKPASSYAPVATIVAELSLGVVCIGVSIGRMVFTPL